MAYIYIVLAFVPAEAWACRVHSNDVQPPLQAEVRSSHSSPQCCSGGSAKILKEEMVHARNQLPGSETDEHVPVRADLPRLQKEICNS